MYPISDFERRVFDQGKDKQLPYRLLKPLYSEDHNEKLFPLIIFLHGAGERGVDNEKQLKHIAALFLDEHNRKQYPCYVMVPQCPPYPNSWAYVKSGVSDVAITDEPSDVMLMLQQLIEKLENELTIDPKRVYVTGVSMGGNGTFDLIMRNPSKFAAAVPICGWADTTKIRLIKDIPLWIFHGAKDDIVSVKYSRRIVQALQEVGGSFQYTEYPDVYHDSWIKAYQEPKLLEWLFSQSKSK